jgi:hypothetical protein
VQAGRDRALPGILPPLARWATGNRSAACRRAGHQPSAGRSGSSTTRNSSPFGPLGHRQPISYEQQGWPPTKCRSVGIEHYPESFPLWPAGPPAADHLRAAGLATNQVQAGRDRALPGILPPLARWATGSRSFTRSRAGHQPGASRSGSSITRNSSSLARWATGSRSAARSRLATNQVQTGRDQPRPGILPPLLCWPSAAAHGNSGHRPGAGGFIVLRDNWTYWGGQQGRLQITEKTQHLVLPARRSDTRCCVTSIRRRGGFERFS